MSRLRIALSAFVLLASSAACSSSHAGSPVSPSAQDAGRNDAAAPAGTGAAAGSAGGVGGTTVRDAAAGASGGADAGLQPPPVTSTGGLPAPDPACPQAAPAQGSPCDVPIGTALSCAWQLGGAIERCACVARQDLPPGAELSWNCEDGVSGEGPPTDTCPERMPAPGSPCAIAGSNCRYPVPGVGSCDCLGEPLRWSCDSGAFGGP